MMDAPSIRVDRKHCIAYKRLFGITLKVSMMHGKEFSQAE